MMPDQNTAPNASCQLREFPLDLVELGPDLGLKELSSSFLETIFKPLQLL